MLELAYGEIAPLRKEVAKLDSNLRSLQLQLRDLMKKELGWNVQVAQYQEKVQLS